MRRDRQDLAIHPEGTDAVGDTPLDRREQGRRVVGLNLPEEAAPLGGGEATGVASGRAAKANGFAHESAAETEPWLPTFSDRQVRSNARTRWPLACHDAPPRGCPRLMNPRQAICLVALGLEPVHDGLAKSGSMVGEKVG